MYDLHIFDKEIDNDIDEHIWLCCSFLNIALTLPVPLAIEYRSNILVPVCKFEPACRHCNGILILLQCL